MNKVNMADIAYTIDLLPSGISGRLVDYAFFFPTLFLAVSIVLFRIKIFVFFIFFYISVLILNLSPFLLDENVYFSINKLDIFNDNNVINRAVFMRNIILFFFIILIPFLKPVAKYFIFFELLSISLCIKSLCGLSAF